MGNADKRGTVQGNGRLSRSGGNIEKLSQKSQSPPNLCIKISGLIWGS